jgi:hypothetical protein
MKNKFLLSRAQYCVASCMIAFFHGTLFALPVDVKGEFGVDSVRISNYRGQETDTASSTNGSQEVVGSGDSAYLQSYILKLNPSIVVNDHVTLFSEVSTGRGRGSRLGEGDYVSSRQGMGHAHFFHTTPSVDGENNLNLNQVYMDIYSETARYRVGRYAREWGLGAIYNGGQNAWDRFFTYYEGFEATFGLGKLLITPSWSNISNNESLNHHGEIKELGLSLLYDNPDKDMKMGLLLSKRMTNGNPIYTAKPDNSPSGTGTNAIIAESSVKMLDIYMSRYWGPLWLAAEIPYVSGTLGNLNGTSTSFKALGIITKGAYEFNDNWSLLGDVGSVSGDQAVSGEFNALYLHPNFQVAELMFRYQLDGVENDQVNVYESSINNALYAKFGAQYKTGPWMWKWSWLMAKADQTARSGNRAFQHTQGYHFTAAADQSDDLGQELDMNFDYQWNPNLVLSGLFAYYFVGDYYAFNNTGSNQAQKNPMAVGLKLDLKF